MTGLPGRDELSMVREALARGDGAAAVSALNRLLVDDPENAEALYLLALCANLAGRPDEAERLLEVAHAAAPDSPVIAHSLGALTVVRDPNRAFDLFQRAISAQPDFAPALTALGNLYRGKGLLGAAREQYERALAADPSLVEVETNLGAILHDQFRHREALTHHDRALSLSSSSAMARSNKLLGLHYSDHVSRRDLFTLHQEIGAAIEADAEQPETGAFRARDRDPDRRLRIGYLSPDFRSHPVGWFFLALAASHDPDAVDVFCYSLLAQVDEQTRRIQAACHRWTDVSSMTDAQTVRTIRRDGIDILVDLTGHTAGNRLSVFAARPAPVQVTWLGYPDTTGLACMDYRISDAAADPEDSLATETLVRLDGGFLCYRPPVSLAIDKARPDGAGIRFGSFNNLAKLNDSVVACWADILNRVPGSCLILKSRSLIDPETVARCRSVFAEHGVDPARLDLRERTVTLAESFTAYNEVDIALDPFPYNGTTTTFDALWMGTPVIALAGDRHSGRVGVSILTHAGLGDLIAETPERYADLAAALAADGGRRSRLAAGLRQRLEASPLMDANGFARRMENAYRAMWRQWCGDTAAPRA